MGDAEETLAKLQAKRAELDEIASTLHSTGDPIRGREAFRRWKNRTLSVVQDSVSHDEAETFRKTYVPLIMGQGEMSALLEELDRHSAALDGLLDEIRKHPDEVLGLRAVANSRVPDEVSATDEDETLSRDPGEGADPRKVFVIHGRDEEARQALFSFLRDLDLHPIEWEELVKVTGKGTPYNGEVVARAFRDATAVIVLMTPDDEVRLHPDLHQTDEEESESAWKAQARPNVFLEAGMALQAQPDRTIFVEIGALRTASDLHGLNVVRLRGGKGALLALVSRLESAGCAVNQSNPNWMDEARFSTLSAVARRPQQEPERQAADLPKGTRLSAQIPTPAPAALTARLHNSGTQRLLEVTNRGGVTLRNIQWIIPEEAHWAVRTQVLPEYPINELHPREHVRVPVHLFMGSAAMVEIVLTADADGEPYEVKAKLSTYD